MNEKKDKIIHYILVLIVFVGLLAYFCVAHPLVLSDTDDWYNASHWRRPLPVWGEFNSIKVFPETFLPICSMIATNLVMPFKHDYLMSLALVYGIVGAVLITTYVLWVSSVVKATGKLSNAVADMVAICFLMFHFLIYKNEWLSNTHLLWAHDVTCLFHYTFSALLNACLVMFFIKMEIVEETNVSTAIWKGKYGYLRSGILLLLLYLAIFSNMFINIILVSFAGIHALLALIFEFEKGLNFRKRIELWFQSKWLYVAIVLMWLVALVFQARDPRNGTARGQGATGSMFGAIVAFVNNLVSINKMALLVMLAIIGLFVYVAAKRKKTDSENLRVVVRATAEIVLSFTITSVYLIILCGVADPSYIGRNDVKIGMFFYILLEVAVLFGWAIGASKDGRLALVVPIITFILVVQAMNYCKSYSDFNMSDFSYEKELEISNDLMEQFVEADEAGLDEFELHVIVNPDADDNWPYPNYAGTLIGDTLFRHGVISRPIKAVTVFDVEKNLELGVY